MPKNKSGSTQINSGMGVCNQPSALYPTNTAMASMANNCVARPA